MSTVPQPVVHEEHFPHRPIERSPLPQDFAQGLLPISPQLVFWFVSLGAFDFWLVVRWQGPQGLPAQIVAAIIPNRATTDVVIRRNCIVLDLLVLVSVS